MSRSNVVEMMVDTNHQESIEYLENLPNRTLNRPVSQIFDGSSVRDRDISNHICNLVFRRKMHWTYITVLETLDDLRTEPSSLRDFIDGELARGHAS